MLVRDNRHVRPSTLSRSCFCWCSFFFSLILIWYYLHVNDMPPKKKSRLITRSAKADLVFVFKCVQDNHQKRRGDGNWRVSWKSTLGEGARPSSSSKPVKTRSFLHTWTKTYSWLWYDQTDDFMWVWSTRLIWYVCRLWDMVFSWRLER